MFSYPYFIRYTSSKTVSDMHIKMHISCRNRKQYEQRNCKTIHTQSIHRKGTVPIPPTDESAGFLGTFFIENLFPCKYLVTFCNNTCRFQPVLYVSYSATSKRASTGFALRAFPTLPDRPLCVLQDNIPSVVATVVLVVVITYCMQYILTAAFSSRF